MIYLREAFKNGVKIKSEKCAMYLPHPLSPEQQETFINTWNDMGKAGPIKWVYSLVPYCDHTKKFEESVEHGRSLGIWDDKQPKHFYFRPPLSEIREDMQKKIEEFHNRGLNE